MNRDHIIETIKKQNGIVFAEPAIVHRCQYSGRNILAKNSSFTSDCVDHRGYVPVEWWIMSKTLAGNDITKEHEGISPLLIHTDNGTEKILLSDAIILVQQDLLGDYASTWPLTKVLDIGGDPVVPSFSSAEEVPPIPCHVHSGIITNGKAHGPGKLEAYFFPPVTVPPYNKTIGKTITRLGIKPDVTKETFITALTQFGKNDDMYTLCNVYEIHPYDGWTIPPGIVHAPGPWPTFEIQRPQDDYNLSSWQLGKRFTDHELHPHKQNLQLRGLKDEETYFTEVVNWKLTTHPEFKHNHYRPSTVIEQGPWGRRIQIFFDAFYGEGFEINPGKAFHRPADTKPFAGIVWSGKGTINDNHLDVNKSHEKEFLVTPRTPVTITNTGITPLLIYTVFPIDETNTADDPLSFLHATPLGNKIKTREEITTLVQDLRAKNPQITIVTTNGSFDIPHIAHVYSLLKAKQHGDILIIGLNSDSSIQQYKSPDRPINPQSQRALMLAAFSFVDYITIFDETDPREFLKTVKPNVHFKSASGFKGIEKDVVEKYGGKIVLEQDVPGLSTTHMIERIIASFKK